MRPDPEKERLQPLPDIDVGTLALPRAEIGVGEGVSVDIHLDSGVLLNGVVANRAMVGVKFKF